MIQKMIRSYKIAKTVASKQFVKFVFIGCGSTFITIGVAQICQVRMEAQTAFIIGYLSSLSLAYCLNSWYIFRDKISFERYIKFVVSYVPNFLIQNIIVGICINLLRLPNVIGYGLGAFVGVPITFLIVKGFVFKKKSRK